MAVALIPRTVLFGNPERIAPRISPDGSHIGWIAPSEGVLNVWLAPRDRLDRARVVTTDRDRGIRSFAFAHDGRHLLYLQDAAGDEDWHLHAVDIDGGSDRDLTPFPSVQAQLIEVDKRFPGEVLIGLNRDNPQLHDVYRVDLASGDLTLVAANPGVVGWVADADWALRGAAAPTPDGGMQLLVRDDPAAEWQVLLDVPADDALTTGPVAFNAAGDQLLAISSVDANAGRLVAFDLAGGGQEVISEDPHYDVAGVRLHPDDRSVQVVAFLKERTELVVLDDRVRPDIEALTALERGELQIVAQDDADRTWLVAFVPDDGPVRYHAWDRTNQTATFLFEHQPALSGYELARMEPFSFTARDGLTIAGYLTFPPGEERHGLPAVVNVHGGPWARDSWGYSPEAQWLANRGYLCVQVNFRGSTGYGKAFTNAGDRQWAAAMHDDVVDATRFVVDQGWADPARLAIYGASYGGYEALVGASFTPDLYACAVDVVGPVNLKTLIESVPAYWAPLIAQFHTRLGNPGTEADFLWERSPLSRVGDIRIPLLIAQGANDPRVKQAESEQIVAALRDRGIDHQYLLFEDEGHGFAKPENRLRFYAAAEAFLARHLGGRAED